MISAEEFSEVSIKDEVVKHNVEQFFLQNLQICRICLETEDDSRGSAFLTPITDAIWTFLGLKDKTFPGTICTKCEAKIVDFMVLMEISEESVGVISRVKEKLENKEELDDISFLSEEEELMENVEFVSDEAPVEEKSTFSVEIPKFECFTCNKVYSKRTSLQHHIRRVHNNPENKCKLCGKFFNEIKMKIHLRSHHKAFECNECGNRFATKSLLKEHLLSIHLRLKSFLCVTCGESFKTAQNLRRHTYKKHHSRLKKCDGTLSEDQKGFCKYCNLRFSDKNELVQHVKEQHTLKLNCQICARKFASEISLENHQKTHKNVEYPFECAHCGSRYLTNAQLRSHVTKFHTFSEQWLCSFCHKSLASRTALQTHEKLHDGVKDYGCFLCEKKFATTRRLREHLVASHTNSRYVCSFCDNVQCISQRGFEAHMKKEHPEMGKVDAGRFFKKDEPTHTKLMEEYQGWAKKITQKRHKESKGRGNSGDGEIMDDVMDEI